MLPPRDSTPKDPINVARCPLCGEPNRCALAADPNASECWCDSEEFPRELLDRIPTQAVRRACVCHNCLKAYRESSEVFDDSQQKLA